MFTGDNRSALCKIEASVFHTVVHWHKLSEMENECILHNVGSEPERIILRKAKTEKIVKQSLQHAINSARQMTKMTKHLLY